MSCDLMVNDHVEVAFKGKIIDVRTNWGTPIYEIETDIKDKDGDNVIVENVPRQFAKKFPDPEPPPGTVGANTGGYNGHWVRTGPGPRDWVLHAPNSPAVICNENWDYVQRYFKPLG